jgi:hypothetical protein
MRTRRPRPAPDARSAFAGFRFPPDVIVLAVRWYLRFGLSYRDIEELLTERRIEVDHVTVYRWVVRFAPLLAEAARPCRHDHGCCQLAPLPPAPLRHQRVQHHHEGGRQGGHLHRGQGPAAPAGPDLDPEWPGPLGDRPHPVIEDHGQQLGHDQHDDQVPEPPQRQQRQH